MKTQISAIVVADSRNIQGDRITTMLVTFPRFILAELNTHRMLSKNSASSRAIPFQTMLKNVEENPFIPIAWQKEHKGMQGSEYITDPIDLELNIKSWLKAKDDAISNAKYLNHGVKEGRDNAVTKQLCNRLLEPFMWTTVLITATEWENFFALRCPKYMSGDVVFRSKKDYSNNIGMTVGHKNELEWLKINKGQAEIQESHMMALAEAMWDAMNKSTPKQLKANQWHIPMIEVIED